MFVRAVQALKMVWLNATFYPLLVIYTAVAVPALSLMVAGYATFVPHRRALRLFRQAIRWYGWGIVRVLPLPFLRVRYEDFSNSGDDGHGPFVVVCNHRSSSDPFLMGCLNLPEFVQVANSWPLRLPVWGIMARGAGYLCVNDMPAERFFEQAGALLRDGVSLVAFPEGTRARGRDIGPFHGTVFRLALQERAAIVPVCLAGSERTPARGTLRLCPGRVTVRRLPALRWETFRDISPFQLKTHVRDLMGRELAGMEAAS